MKNYDPKNWFWTVGGDATKAFSSAAGDYVPVTDPAFVAWLADGTMPTVIDTEANLGAVLAPYLQRPSNSGVLDGYAGSQADTVLTHLAFKILFNHENRIRALEGKAAVTAAQARSFVKGLM